MFRMKSLLFAIIFCLLFYFTQTLRAQSIYGRIEQRLYRLKSSCMRTMIYCNKTIFKQIETLNYTVNLHILLKGHKICWNETEINILAYHTKNVNFFNVNDFVFVCLECYKWHERNSIYSKIQLFSTCNYYTEVT